MTITGRAQAPVFRHGVSELKCGSGSVMFGVESYKPVRASRLHMWSGCPKARIRLPTENRQGRVRVSGRRQVAADSGSRPMARPMHSRECTNLPTSVEESVKSRWAFHQSAREAQLHPCRPHVDARVRLRDSPHHLSTIELMKK